MVRAADPLDRAAPRTTANLAVLAAWAPEVADTFVALSSDLALVLDAAGRIVRLAQRPDSQLVASGWPGRAWVDTVSEDSRPKVEAMLDELRREGRAGQREINHPSDGGGFTVPMAYAAVRLGGEGPVLAVAHNLQAQASLQRRFVEAQQALERSYWASAGLAVDGLGIGDQPPTRLEQGMLVALRRLADDVGQRDDASILHDVRGLAERHFLDLALARDRDLGASPGHGGRRRTKPE